MFFLVFLLYQFSRLKILIIFSYKAIIYRLVLEGYKYVDNANRISACCSQTLELAPSHLQEVRNTCSRTPSLVLQTESQDFG